MLNIDVVIAALSWIVTKQHSSAAPIFLKVR